MFKLAQATWSSSFGQAGRSFFQVGGRKSLFPGAGIRNHVTTTTSTIYKDEDVESKPEPEPEPERMIGEPPKKKRGQSSVGTFICKINVDGIDLNWMRFGEGDHVVLLLPGLVGSVKSNWVPVTDKMDLEKFMLIGVDPPGYGRSRPPNRNVFQDENALEKDAQITANLMDKLGYEKYSMVGWSNGGLTAAIIAGLYPERVNKIVMCNTPSGFSEHTAKTMDLMTDLDNWTPTQRRALLNDYDRDYVEGMLKDWKKVMDGLTTEKCKMYKDRLANYIINLKRPFMYIQGAKDPAIPKTDVNDYAAWSSDFRHHIVENGAHDHLEFVDEFVKVVEDFLLTEPVVEEPAADSKDAEKSEGDSKDAEKSEGDAKDPEKSEDDAKDAKVPEAKDAKDAKVSETKDAEELEAEFDKPFKI